MGKSYFKAYQVGDDTSNKQLKKKKKQHENKNLMTTIQKKEKLNADFDELVTFRNAMSYSVILVAGA